MKRRNFCFAAFMITFAILCARSLEGQNLLQNPDFDVDVSDWSNHCGATYCYTMTWSSQDADGSPTSGSALITAVQGGPEQAIFPVFEGVNYDFGAAVRSGEVAGSTARVSVSWYTAYVGGGSCGSSLLREDTTLSGGGGTWARVAATSTAPKGARCARVQLIVAAGPGFPGSTYLDDVFFTRQNTTGSFYTVTPCRIIDTRTPDGAFGGPAFAPLSTRTFAIPGNCEVPVDATAVAANLTVTNATGAGHFIVYAAGTPQPSTSTLNFSSRQTRANNAILTLGVSGQITVFCTLPFGGTADLVLDVAGYFQ